MRRGPAPRVLGLWLITTAACFEPVDANPHLLVACTGSCPLGECSDTCAALADAGPCNDPVSCLMTSACAGKHTDCSAYTPGRYQSRASCAATPGAYCATTADGSSAVHCSDAGVTVTACSVDPCRPDAGAPPECKGVCSPAYCVH